MAITTRELELGGKKFMLAQLPAMRALRLSARLGKMFGPALIGAIMAGGLNSDALPALATLFDRLSPEELEVLTRELLANATVIMTDDNGRQQNAPVMDVFDGLFQGRLQDVLQLLREALVLNFGATFSELVAAASARKPPAASA